jgi:long-chain acyl-CoA synthetase
MDRRWLKFYDDGVPHSYPYPDETLPQMLERVAREHSNDPATDFHGRILTYAQLEAQVERFCTGLINAGFKPGERIAVMLPNLPQFIVAFYGAMRAGLVVVPTNPMYKHRELQYQLADSGSVAIVTLPQCLPTVADSLDGTEIRLVIVATINEVLPRIMGIAYGLKNHPPKHRFVAVPVKPWREILAVHGTASLPAPDDDLAVLQYTGGTTGASKGAMLTHHSLLANAIQVFIWQVGMIRGSIRTLAVTPFFHVYGLSVGMNMTIWGHGLLILVPRFDAANVRKVIKKERPNLMPGVPTMYIALEHQPDVGPDELSSLDICISGAAPLPAAVQADFPRIAPMARLVEGYGLTEASPVTHCNPCNGARPGTVGIPFADTDCRIIDPDSWDDMPEGQVGEVAASGPQLMLGYWKRDDETERVIKDGWLRTGDMGFVDEDGFLHIVDRIKDMIIAGGYNVYPREIEEVLFHHPGILEASVVGYQSEYRGETVRAFIVRRPGSTVTEAEIIAYCKEELAAYKVPKMVEFVDELPKSLIGKVLRRKLREMEADPEQATPKPAQS